MPKKNPSRQSQRTIATIRANAQAALERIRKLNEDAAVRKARGTKHKGTK